MLGNLFFQNVRKGGEKDVEKDGVIDRKIEKQTRDLWTKKLSHQHP